MPDYYYTIEAPSEGQYREKGSKFIAFAYPADNENQIKSILEYLRKNYHDARHHCYAWSLGSKGQMIRANDDGEPSNSAGKPILGQIQSFGLTNILIVVVRYFGGTLLGVGGLVNAYRSAAKAALQNAHIKKEYLKAVYEIIFQYQEMNHVMTIIKDMDAHAFDQDFQLECKLKLSINLGEKEKLEKAFTPFQDIKLKLIMED